MDKGREDALGDRVTAVPAFPALWTMPESIDDNGMALARRLRDSNQKTEAGGQEIWLHKC